MSMQCNMYWLMSCSRRRKVWLTRVHPRVKREASLVMGRALNIKHGELNTMSARNLKTPIVCDTVLQTSPMDSEDHTDLQSPTKNKCRCLRCGRKLTNPTAVELGYGPVCYAKLQQEKFKKLF